MTAEHQERSKRRNSRSKRNWLSNVIEQHGGAPEIIAVGSVLQSTCYSMLLTSCWMIKDHWTLVTALIDAPMLSSIHLRDDELRQ